MPLLPESRLRQVRLVVFKCSSIVSPTKNYACGMFNCFCIDSRGFVFQLMIAMRHWMRYSWRVSPWQMYRCVCSKVSFCTAAPVMMAVEDLEALREENYLLQAQNELIALFLGLHPDPRPIDACQGDAVCAANRCLDKPRKLAKRKRPPRRATTSRSPCYAMDPQAAFAKYGASPPDSPEDALLVMNSSSHRDLRRATRICMMELLFPDGANEDDALRKLDAFLRNHAATCELPLMRMSLFKHLHGSVRPGV